MHRRNFLVLVVAGLAVANPLLAAESSRHHDQPAPKKRAAASETAFGREGDARKVSRVIRIRASDTMRFFPDEVRVKRGDTVRFNVHNEGQLPHEMVLGTLDDLKKHADLMRKEHVEMAHEDAHVTHVLPGETGRIVWQFTRAGEFYFACLIPGHFEAGMMGTIIVR